MEKTMFRVKTILFTIYDLLCLYTVTFCAYSSVGFVSSILCRTKFADYMLEMNDWYPTFYIMAVIVGGACCIFLCIEYSKQPKVFAPLLTSLFIHPIVIFTMPYSATLFSDRFGNPTTNRVIGYLYWLLIACTIAVIVYSVVILVKERKLLKKHKSET